MLTDDKNLIELYQDYIDDEGYVQRYNYDKGRYYNTGICLKGTKGNPGNPGRPGKDGLTPRINQDNGHWMIGDVDTGVSAIPEEGGDGVFDVSEKYPTSGVNGGNTYTLQGALTVLNANLPASKKKGGMSIKFVQSSDNKYVKFFCTADEFTTDVTKWQGVTNEVKAGSRDLVESGGVEKFVNNKVPYNIISEDGGEIYTYVSLNIKSGNKYVFQKTTNFSYEGSIVIYLRVDKTSAGQASIFIHKNVNYVEFTADKDYNYILFYNTTTTQGGTQELRVFDENEFLISKINNIAFSTGQLISNTGIAESVTKNSEDLVKGNEVWESVFEVKNELKNMIIDDCSITLKGTETSKLELSEPIELTSDGDELEIEVSNIGERTFYTFSNSGQSTNSYYALALSKSMIGLRALDNTWLYNNKSIVSSTAHKIKISFYNGNILTYVDNVLIDTYSGQKDIAIKSFGNGGNGRYGYWSGRIDSIKHNGTNLKLIEQNYSDVELVNVRYKFTLADAESSILKYSAATKTFRFYSKYGSTNKYIMFQVSLSEDNSDLVYLKEWRWSSGKLCVLSDGEFVEVKTVAISLENEMAMRFKDAIDYTGGVHGDERIDVSADSFVNFFADGKLITDSEMESDFSIVCNCFSYTQLSSLHQTSTTDGQFVSGHPIIAMHYKQNTFENCQSQLENRVFFTSEQYVTQYHAGMMCVGKDAATYALLPNAVKTPQLTGDNTYYNANNKKVSRVDMWNPSSEIRCYVCGDMIEGIAESEINILQVWDRANDTKYYRRMAVGDSNAKVFHNGDTIINKQFVKYY